MKIYFVARWNCEHHGKACQPIGVALTEAEAVAMCEIPQDGITELEAGTAYPLNRELPDGIRCRYPRCAQDPNWQTARGLALAEC